MLVKIKLLQKLAIIFVVTLLLTACGGGSGSGDDPNAEIKITSEAKVTAVVGTTYSYDIAVLEETGLKFELLEAPEGMMIDPESGLISWTPTADQAGSQEVRVKVSSVDDPDVSASQEFTVSVNVKTPANIDPQITSAASNSAKVNELYTYSVEATDENSGDVLTYSLEQFPEGMSIDAATGIITWIPSSQQDGLQAIVSIKVIDGNDGSDIQNYIINVQDEPVTVVNNAPVISPIANTEAKANENFSFSVIASDPNNDSLTYSLTQAPTGMSIDSNGIIKWVPSEDHVGVSGNTVTVKVSDSGSPILFDSEEFTINVKSTIVAPENNNPIAVNDSASVNEDEVLRLFSADLLGNDKDDDVNDVLSIISVIESSVTHGTVKLLNGGVEYTPELNFSGEAAFGYKVSDGNGGVATAEVNVNVVAKNDAPNAADDIISATEDTPLIIKASELLANDTDVDASDILSISNVSPNDDVHGTIDMNGSEITYTPEADFSGAASFSYTINDGNLGTSTAKVVVNVSSANDNPVAVQDNIQLDEDTEILISLTDLLSNDTDLENDSLNVISVTKVDETHGAVALNETGVLYTPAADFSGEATFQYTIADGNGGEAIGEVVANVLPINDAPTISGIPSTIAGVGNPYRFEPVPGDVDGLDDIASYSINIDPSEFGFTFDTATGVLSGTPTSAQSGSTIATGIVISVEDLAGETASLAAFDISVSEQPVQPVIFPPNGRFTNDVVVTIDPPQGQAGTIYYTTNATDPGPNNVDALVYSGMITFTEDTELRARFFDGNGIGSDLAIANYKVSPTAGGRLGAYYSDRESTSVDLSAKGIIDWAHWGADDIYSYNHKAGVEPQIGEISYLVSDVSRIEESTTQNLQPALHFPNSSYSYSWSDGVPAASNDSTSGTYIELKGDGYSLSLPASTMPRRLYLYLAAVQSIGKISATLNDGSAAPYVDSIDSALSSTGIAQKVVVITFAAATDDQTLTIKYTLSHKHNPAGGNISMRAAAMTAPFDARPFVAKPVLDSAPGTYTDLTSVTMSSATNGAKIYYTLDGSEPTDESNEYDAPFDVNTTTVIKARAYNAGFEPSDVVTAQYTINPSQGGELTAFFTPHMNAVDLTTEGDADWMHLGFGDLNGINRKTNVSEQLTYSIVGAGIQKGFSFSSTDKVFSWTDGAPEAVVAETTSGIFIEQLDSGFRITAPADATKRNLNIYLGAFDAKGKVTVSLSDGSVADAIGFLDSPGLKSNQYLAVEYSSFSESATVTVEYILDTKYGDFGNVAIQAATLSGVSKVSTPVISPGGDVLFGNEAISIASATAGATVYYTLDGNDPTTSDFEYTGPFSLPASVDPVTVKAIAVKSGLINSSFALAEYTVDSTTGCNASPTTIMPLGDSITAGTMGVGIPADGFRVGYREELYNDLNNAGYSFDFVGGLVDGDLANPSMDADHEGHGGFKASEVSLNVESWLAANPSDYVLLHIGTNDLFDGVTPSDAAASVAAVLRAINTVSPNTRIVLARIINTKGDTTDQGITTEFNTKIAAIAEEQIAQGSRITVVDMESALNYTNDMFNELHPNEAGYSKIEGVWFNALDTLLPTPVSCP